MNLPRLRTATPLASPRHSSKAGQTKILPRQTIEKLMTYDVTKFEVGGAILKLSTLTCQKINF